MIKKDSNVYCIRRICKLCHQIMKRALSKLQAVLKENEVDIMKQETRTKAERIENQAHTTNYKKRSRQLVRDLVLFYRVRLRQIESRFNMFYQCLFNSRML